MSENSNTGSVEAGIEKTREEMSKTLDAIQQKLTPGRMVDEVLGYFRGEPEARGVAAGLIETAKQNRLPVALIGVGIGWMLLSGGGGKAGYSERSASSTNRARSLGRDGAGRHAGTNHDGAVDNQAGLVKTSVSHAGAEAKSAVAEAAYRLTDVADELQSRGREAVSALPQQAEEFQEAAGYQVERARNGFDRLLRDQPLTLIGLGFTLGAALGAALPPARREREADDAKDTALGERARGAGQRFSGAKSVAQAALDAAREEAAAEGLSATAVKENLERVGTKAKRVVRAAQGAAKKEANADDGQRKRNPRAAARRTTAPKAS